MMIKRKAPSAKLEIAAYPKALTADLEVKTPLELVEAARALQEQANKLFEQAVTDGLQFLGGNVRQLADMLHMPARTLHEILTKGRLQHLRHLTRRGAGRPAASTKS